MYCFSSNYVGSFGQPQIISQYFYDVCPFIDRCNMPLGVADRRIANPLITASSYHSFYCGPWNARLHQRRVSRLGGSWCTRRNDLRQWLQVSSRENKGTERESRGLGWDM